MLNIAKKFLPTADARRASSEAFYVLCDKYEEWKDKTAFQDAIDDLRQTACFPAEGNTERWYSPEFLYAPYRADAFRSQAHILDFRSAARIKTELLKDLNVSINPETRLVVEHLRHCMSSGIQPHVLTYRVLNERAQRSDPLISTLARFRCIYVDSQKEFVRPNQLFWTPQQLGRYAFTIPGNLESFKPLFNAIGVKNAPDGRDFIDILLDIVGAHFEQSTPVNGPDRAVYDTCLAGASAAHEREELASPDLRRLQEAPIILNLRGALNHPDEILLQDSEWHASFFNGELDRALCKLSPELWSLAEGLGVKRLSESAQVALEYVDGPEGDETPLAERLMERTDILARLLHDKPTAVRKKVRDAFSKLEAVSYDVVRIQASVQVAGYPILAPSASAHAFYDIENGRLILLRPVSDCSWAHILNAIFHQLMPEETGNEISKLILNVSFSMEMPIEKAHRQLTDAGFPYLDPGPEIGDTDELTSLDLDKLGTSEDPTNREETDESPSTDLDSVSRDEASNRKAKGKPSEKRQANPDEEPSDQTACEANSTSPKQAGTGGVGSAGLGGNQGMSSGEKRPKKARPKYKEQWDRRLLSYVQLKQQKVSETDDQATPSEHNLAVEVVARNAVCAYEKERGRIAEQMAQTHPGYDIISRNPVTGEDRFIEVKGVAGEWNQTGVGLSRLQFSNAQDYGDRYWLYVVEFASDPGHIRVHPIRSPATQVTAFMFDGNWREAVTEERADPSSLFVPGVRVHHQDMGTGEILDVIVRGNTKLLAIQLDGKSQATPNVALNLHRMRVLEDADDDNHS